MTVVAAIASGGKKDEVKFTPGPASSYESKQTNAGVTIAAMPYVSEEMAHTAFGKTNPNHYGFLPILVIIQNDSTQALKLDHMRVKYSVSGGGEIEATPPREMAATLNHADRPVVQSPIPGLGRKKNPLSNWEMEGHPFAARLLAPHDSASGVFYFQSSDRANASIVIDGMQEAGSGKELFYFEIPLGGK